MRSRLRSIEFFTKRNAENVRSETVRSEFLNVEKIHFFHRPSYFEKQLELPKLTKKPLFLHCRNAYDDFLEIINRHHSDLHGGVVSHAWKSPVSIEIDWAKPSTEGPLIHWQQGRRQKNNRSRLLYRHQWMLFEDPGQHRRHVFDIFRVSHDRNR